MTPPQKATSDQHWPCATLRLISRFSTVVVGGMEFKGMSTTVVTPPETAALVPVQKPSQSVRPGSFKCTCALGDRVQAVVLAVVHTDLLYEPRKYVPFADVEHLDVGMMFPCIFTEVVQVDGHDFA